MFVKRFLMVLACINLIYFIYDYGVEMIFQQMDEVEAPNVNSLKAIYDPVFKLSHRYYTPGTNRSISLELARSYWREGKLEEAYTLFERAEKEFPNDLYVKLDYANFLIFNNDQLNLAKSKLNFILFIQPEHKRANLLLAYIAITEGNLDLAVVHMKCRYLDRRSPFLSYLEIKLYQKGYWTSKIGIDNRIIKDINDRVMGSTEVERLGAELLQIDIEDIRLRQMRVLLNNFINKLENEMFRTLDSSSLMKYLESTSKYTYGFQLWIVYYYSKPTLEQMKLLEEAIHFSFINQRLCRFLDQTSMDIETSCEKEDLTKMLRLLFSKILTSDQFRAVVNYEKRMPTLFENIL